ncbi:hypothetical protein DHB74_12855 [Pseudomonas sp. G11-1]|nr:hypothetical protein [Pseudomonas sp. G11-1]MCO5790474.1 hypothetical protein [Pseudomonas sp. G11-2]
MKKENIDHTTYASIAIRVDSELKRIRRVFELSGEATYEALPSDAFLVSKDRYKSVAASAEECDGDDESGQKAPQSNMHIDTVNIQYAADSQAVSKLEALEKETTIGANFSNIISFLRSLFGS